MEWMDGIALRRIEGLMFVSLDFLSFDELEKRSKRKLRSLTLVDACFRSSIDRWWMLLSSPRSPSRNGLLFPPWNLLRRVRRWSMHRRIVPQRLDQELRRGRMHSSSSLIRLLFLFALCFSFLLLGSSLVFRLYYVLVSPSFLIHAHPRYAVSLPFSRLILSLFPFPSSEPCFCSSRFTPHSHLLLPHTHTCLPLSLALRSVPCCLEQDLMLSLSNISFESQAKEHRGEIY